MALERGNDVRHPHDGRVVSRRIPRDGRLEALEEQHLVGGLQELEHLLEPRPVAEETADDVLHLERLAAAPALAERDRMREDRRDRRKLGPQLVGLEHLDVLAVDRNVGVFELAELLDLSDDERDERRGRLRVLHEAAERGAAGRLRAKARDDFGDSRKAELGNGGVELRLRLVGVREEGDHRADLAGRQRRRGGDVALALPEVRAHVGRGGTREAELEDERSEARVKRIVDVARGGHRELEAVGDLGLRVVGCGLEAALRDVFADSRKDKLRVGLVRERREPAVAVVLDGRLEADRIGALRGNLDELVLVERLPRLFPELLPVDGLDEAVLDADVLETDNRHVAVALQDFLDEIAGALLEQFLERRGVGLAENEDVALRRDLEHVAGGGVGKLVVLLRLEIDGDALVEVVEALHLAEAPRLAEDESARLEADELLELDERLVKRTLSEADAVQKRKKKTISCRLLQCIPYTRCADLLVKFCPVFAHEPKSPFEVLLLRALVQLVHQRFRIGHLPLLSKNRRILYHKFRSRTWRIIAISGHVNGSACFVQFMHPV